MTIEEAINLTIEDFKLSRNEKKALDQLFSEHRLSKKDILVLKSKVFKLAKEKTNSINGVEIIEWLEGVLKVIDKRDQSKISISTYFSPGEECRIAILNEIKNAKNSLDICVFTITDNQIAKEIERAHSKGLKVRIISDNDKSGDLGSDIYRFHKNGLDVKIDETDKHMHHKFMIVDGLTVLTGSYNWTVSAAEKNEENIIILDDPKAVIRFQQEFNALWKNFSKYS